MVTHYVLRIDTFRYNMRRKTSLPTIFVKTCEAQVKKSNHTFLYIIIIFNFQFWKDEYVSSFDESQSIYTYTVIRLLSLLEYSSHVPDVVTFQWSINLQQSTIRHFCLCLYMLDFFMGFLFSLNELAKIKNEH